jgi:hypothetical protein
VAKAKSDDLVDEIDVIRERLAETVDTLVDRTNPKNIARRTLSDVKARFVDEKTGSPKLETILPVVGGVVAVVAGIVIVRRLLR